MAAETKHSGVSKFERMSVEELEEAIRIYFQSDDLEENMEDLLLAAEELTRKKEAMGDRIDTEANLARFKREYLPLLDEAGREDGDAEEIINPAEIAAEGSRPRTQVKRMTTHIFRVAAVAVLAALILGMTACAVIPEVRANIYNFVLQLTKTHAALTTEDTEDPNNPDSPMPSDIQETNQVNPVEFGGYSFDIPLPFEIDSTSTDENGSFCLLTDGTHFITIQISSLGRNNLSVDIEETQVEPIQFGENDGAFFDNGTLRYLTWRDQSTGDVVYIGSSDLSKEAILQIAESYSHVN